MENYEILKKIGSGNFAKVHLAYHAPTRKQVALKLISKKGITNVKNFQRVHREIGNMKKLGAHEGIVTIYETFETEQHYVIAMEYLPGGELFDHILEREGLPENTTKEMFTQIVKAVQYCHQTGIAHRDLKLENILLDKKNSPKIADFGLSKDIQSRPMLATNCGSPLYTSPEMILGKPYLGTECDVWSLGVILYTMLTASMPFDDSNFPKFMQRVEKGEYPAPLGVSDAVTDLISRMLNPNSETRITIEEILSHPWIAGLPKLTNTLLRTNKKRRNGVCIENTEYIHKALLHMNECNCSCHKTENAKGHRDSVITKHCSDCDDFQANDPAIMERRQVRLSRNSSICSSGYGSEYGSTQALSSMGESQIGIPFFESSRHPRNHAHRNSLPRKNVVTDKYLSFDHRNSFPASIPNILQEQSESEINLNEYDEDEDIVFV